jgi:adenylate cyclase
VIEHITTEYMNKIIIVFALLISKQCQSQSYPENIILKSYAIQSVATDSMFKTMNSFDSTLAISNFNRWIELANAKNDKRLGYLIQINKYKWQLYHKETKDFEKDMVSLIKQLDKKDISYLKAEALWVLGDYYWGEKKNLSLGLENHIYAYNISTEYPLSFFPHKGEIIYRLGLKYYYFRDFRTAINYYLEFWRTVPYEQANERPSKLNSLALCYQNVEQYDSASYYYKKGLEAAKKTGDKAWISLSMGNLAYSYETQKRYDEALALYEENRRADSLNSHKNESIDAADGLASVALIYYIKNDKKKALELANKAYEMLLKKKKNMDYYDVKVIYPRIAKVFAGNGQTELAYSLLEQVTEADDSVFKSKNLLLLAGVQHKTDAERHMADIKKREEELSWQKKLRNTFITGFSLVLLLSIFILYQKRRITKEKGRSDELLLNILPAETAEELKQTGSAIAKKYDNVSVIFTDFKNFTEVSQKMTAEELVREIDYCYSAFDDILSRYNIEKIKTIGDSYMCVAGLPIEANDHAKNAIAACLEITRFIEKEKEHRKEKGMIYFEMRIGIHSGPVVAGIVGKKKFAYDIWGDTVNIASRMESTGSEGKINISETTYELIKDTISCEYRGEVEVKNRGKMKMYFVNTLTGKDGVVAVRESTIINYN